MKGRQPTVLNRLREAMRHGIPLTSYQIAIELEMPHRTATKYIAKYRAAGHVEVADVLDHPGDRPGQPERLYKLKG